MLFADIQTHLAITARALNDAAQAVAGSQETFAHHLIDCARYFDDEALSTSVAVESFCTGIAGQVDSYLVDIARATKELRRSRNSLPKSPGANNHELPSSNESGGV